MSRRSIRFRKVNCIVCLSEFETNHSQGKYCSEKCRREGWRKSWNEYRERNKKSRIAYQRKHYRENAEAIKERIKKYRVTPAGIKARKVNEERQKIKNPEKIFARQVVRAAIIAGILQKEPCFECGEKKVEGHHEDYWQPLKVVWLCRKHHDKRHRKES